MRDPRATGDALARTGQLWHELGQPELAAAAFTMALERGSVDGALGLSRLAEVAGQSLDAAARPLDDAVARNLRSPELHARYAELLDRHSSCGGGIQAEWHRREAERLSNGHVR